MATSKWPSKVAVNQGLKRFFQVFEQAPLSTQKYWDIVKWDKATKDFPRPHAILLQYTSMIEAWLKNGIQPDFPRCQNPECNKQVSVKRSDQVRKWCSKACAYLVVKRHVKPHHTKAEIDAFLRKFHKEFGMAPLSSHDYWELGKKAGYPAPRQIWFYYSTMIRAWKGAGVQPDFPKCEMCDSYIEVSRPDNNPKWCLRCQSRGQSQSLRSTWQQKTKYKFNGEFAWIDKALVKAYENPKAPISPPIQKLMLEKHGIEYPKHALLKRARELGLGRVKDPIWSMRELEILNEYSYMNPEAIVKKLKAEGYKRSRSAIVLMRKRTGLNELTEWWSPDLLSRLIGLDIHKVLKWCREGKLPYVVRFQRSKGHPQEMKAIHEVDIYIFLVLHREEYDLRKLSQRWLLAMLVDFPRSHAEAIEARLKERSIELPVIESEFTRHWFRRKSSGKWIDRPKNQDKANQKRRAVP